MAAIDPATLDRWRTLSIVDRDGGTVGSISEFYLDRETRYPTWALVNVGLFGARQMFVPLLDATEIRDGLQVPYEKSHIKDAPRIDLHGELTPDEEATLFAHYGIDYQPAGDTESAEEPEAADGAGDAEARAAEEARVAEARAAGPGGAAGVAAATGVAGVGTAGVAGVAGVAGAVHDSGDRVAEAEEPGSGGLKEPGSGGAEAGDADADADGAGAEAEAGPGAAEAADAAEPGHGAAAEPGSPEHAAADDELAWPASPPPPGPITEPPTEPPEVPRDR
jgi:PRC-barrel domain